jgi:hypothetical protein
LGYEKSLEKFYNQLKKDKKLSVEFFHKNYEWKKDSKSRLPGWNFLSFKKIGIRSFHPWMTEYEPYSKRKIRKKPNHPNGVQGIKGFVFSVNHDGEKFFSTLLGKKLSKSIFLSCGTEVFFEKGKNNRFEKVILQAKSIKKVLREFDPDDEIEFHGKTSALIKNPSRGWDIVITD